MPTTIETYPLDRKKITKRFVGNMTGWLVLSLMISLALLFGVRLDLAAFLLLLIGLLLLCAAWQWFYEHKYFDAYFYDLDKDFLKIRKDWITPRETILPYEKLQDVYVDQDLFDRIFGLWDVHVSTATMASGMEAHIDGINQENAVKIRELLLDKIRSKEKRATGYD